MSNEFLIQPDWPAPKQIRAYTTLRESGLSSPENRLNKSLAQTILDAPAEPIWLKQIHSNIVVPATPENRDKEADASYTNQPNQVCAITTADCLPVLLCDKKGTHIAAIHAGWRGLTKNIIPETIKALDVAGNDLLAWIGPGISQEKYEVGEEVRQLFIENDSDNVMDFIPSPNQRWLVNLSAIAKRQLQKAHVQHIYGGNFCTYTDKQNFFSYRRDGKGCGFILTAIWIDNIIL